MQTLFSKIAQELAVQEKQVAAAVGLLDEGSSVPFISRYRKEVTGGLDDTQLRNLEDRLGYLRELEDRRGAILKSIKEQDKLTPELKRQIENADTKTRLEDLYLPYKPRRRTKAQIAREAGLALLAETLLANPERVPEEEAIQYINIEHKVADVKAALEGARQILMEQFSEDAQLLEKLRQFLRTEGWLHAQVNKGKESEGAKYQDYFEYKELWNKVPSHRALALFRGRKEGILAVHLGMEEDPEPGSKHVCEQIIAEHLGIAERVGLPAYGWLEEVVRWTWRVKLSTHMETEFLGELREKAELEAIQVFAQNLKDLLLAAPGGQKVTMGLDPGLRTGVKLAVVGAQGEILDHGAIFPTPPQNRLAEAEATVLALCEKHQVELIAIGNGTASRETEKFVGEVLQKHKSLSVQKVMVNEAGASVYSASEFAAKEFPDLDVTIRGAISIAKRLQDPLAELVKIDPKSIGVGQYQHDVSQTRLAKSLGAVVEDCVNGVGVEINTASAPLLSRVSGLSASIANNIVEFRQKNGAFKNRNQLKKVPRLGDRAFEQAAGFLRIRGGDNPLDASAVHPESYPLVKKIAQSHARDLSGLMGDSAFLRAQNAESYVDEKFGLPTVRDILQELEKPGRDPRPEFQTAQFKEGVDKISDLKPGMILEGAVTNVTQFGAFVDVGVHQDGLVHISALANEFVKDPRQVVKAGDIVKVKVMQVDVARKRIGMSMRLDDSPEENNASTGKAREGRSGKPRGTGFANKQKVSPGKTGTMAALFEEALKKKK